MNFQDLVDYGAAVPLGPNVRRITAPNPGPLTGPGTNTYLVGHRDVVVIDPGPALEEHVQAILDAAAQGGGAVTKIVASHTHPDHSPGAVPLAARTGAPVLGMAAPDDGKQDVTWNPDAFLADEDVIETSEAILDVVHTPGHASNHLCFLERKSGLLFTGDHVMNGSTVVILPPDGRMADYVESLRKLRTLGARAIAPGHGDVIDDPDREIDWIIEHRLEREAKVLRHLGDGDTLDTLVVRVYDDVPARIHPLAKRSLLAHLIKLRDDGRASESDGVWQQAAPR
ncbi:MAG: MBL fold metallo-hydrolase [Pseudomonadota bacterium]